MVSVLLDASRKISSTYIEVVWQLQLKEIKHFCFEDEEDGTQKKIIGVYNLTKPLIEITFDWGFSSKNKRKIKF